MKPESTKSTLNSAAFVEVVHTMVKKTASVLSDAVGRIEREDPISERDSEEAFAIGFALAKGIYSLTAITRVLTIVSREKDDKEWKEELEAAIDAIDNARNDDPMELIEDQIVNLESLSEITGRLAEKMNQRILD